MAKHEIYEQICSTFTYFLIILKVQSYLYYFTNLKIQSQMFIIQTNNMTFIPTYSRSLVSFDKYQNILNQLSNITLLSLFYFTQYLTKSSGISILHFNRNLNNTQLLQFHQFINLYILKLPMKATKKESKRTDTKQKPRELQYEHSEISYNTIVDNNINEYGESVSVALRIRPLSLLESNRSDVDCFKMIDDKNCQLSNKQVIKNFRFNNILYEKATQQNLYDSVRINDYLNSALDGYAVTVFAYGQTGSGKTYTMAGIQQKLASEKYLHDDKDGIIPRAIKNLWGLVGKRKDKFALKASFCQIYNQQIKDLLNPTSGVLHCRWNSANGFFVQDLMIVDCTSTDDMIAVLNEGIKNRRSGSHELNKDSSRSHSILTMYLISEQENSGNNSQTIRKYGKIAFVDLAGSQRLKQSKSQGIMAKQTGNINKSLFTLGKVIKGLSDRKSKNPYIPYRDSKLTMLLMDSLGGTSKALMIACVSPSVTYFDETLSTLNYATRTMNIKNKPVVQMNQKDQLIYGLIKQRDLLRLQNQYLTQQIQRANKGIKIQPPVFNKTPIDLPPINKSMSMPKPQKKPHSQKGFYKPQNQSQPQIGIDKIVKQYQYELSRLERENGELKNLRQISQKNYHNTHNDNHALQIKLDNLQNLFIKNGTGGKSIQQQYMNNNIVSQNVSLRNRITVIEEQMFALEEEMRRQTENDKSVQQEMLIRKMKAENRNLTERVQFLQKREKQLLDALKK